MATLLPDPFQATYDDANEQLQYGNPALTTLSLAYDANGSIEISTAGSEATTYSWDARNRLIAISSPSLSASFGYDALGRRVRKVINGVLTEYLYDGHDVFQEIKTKAVTSTHLRHHGSVDEVFIRTLQAGAEYYGADAIGSVVTLTNENGTSHVRYTYEAYGNTTASGSSSNDVQFTGRENDATGLYYYRARYYSPAQARFISEDPIRLAAVYRRAFWLAREYSPTPAGSSSESIFFDEGSNLYEYVGGNPLNFIDPYGLDRQFPPGIGCKPLVYGILQGAVDALCKVHKRTCRRDQAPVLTCEEIQKRINQNWHCANARDEMNRKCWGGGNEGHRKAAAEARQAMINCLNRFAQECPCQKPSVPES